MKILLQQDIAITKAWILTYGSNVGIAQVVGDIADENDHIGNSVLRNPIIGIIPWGNIVGRMSLISTRDKVVSTNIYLVLFDIYFSATVNAYVFSKRRRYSRHLLSQ